MRRLIAAICTWLFAAVMQPVYAGAQKYEPLAASVQAAMQESIFEKGNVGSEFITDEEKTRWLAEMSLRLKEKIPNNASRIRFLKTVHYEAKRAGLDPQLVLGLIQVESNFRKYAVSRAGARGYMQVMPFWIKLIGKKEHNLFHLRVNLRYGCTILRHYLDIEHGSLYRALGRYNGSLGKSRYPNLVRAAWQDKWAWRAPQKDSTVLSSTP